MKQILCFLNKYGLYLLIGFIVFGFNYCLLYNQQKILYIFFEVLFGLIGLYLILFEKLKLFYFIIFIIPLSVSVNMFYGSAMSFPSEGLIAIFALFIIVKSLIKSPINLDFIFHPITIILIVDLLWFLLVSAYSTIPLFSFKRTLIKFIFLSVFYFFIANLLSNKKNFKKIYILYSLGMIIPILTAIIYHAKYNFHGGAAYRMTFPFFNDHTIYGAVLAFLIPILIVIVYNYKVFELSKRSKSWLWILTILICIAFILSYSRAAWLSMFLCIFFSVVIYFKISFNKLVFGVIISSAIIYFNFNSIEEIALRNNSRSNTGDISEHIESFSNIQSDASNAERINRWKCALRMFYDKPYLGFGPGTYQYNYGSYQIRSEMTRISTVHGNRGHAHSEYLTYLSETGFPGFIIFITLIFYTIFIGLRVIYKSGVIFSRLMATGLLLALFSYFIHAFFNAFLDSDKMAVLFYSALAGIVILDISVTYEKKEQN